jgi:uracil-DNA glycosylase family 4
LQNVTPLDSLWSFDPLSGDSAAILQWLQDAGVTAVTGNQFGENVFSPQQDRLDQIVEAIEKPLKSSVAAVPATPQSWDEDLAQCADMESLQAYMRDFKGLSLCMTATQAVLGTGQTQQPVVMVIGEAPDATEDQNGLAFSGAAHHMIRTAMQYAQGSLDQVYMTYVSKWRPPGQRALLPQEQQLAQSILAREIAFVQPRHIILLGELSLRIMTRVADSVVKTQETQTLTHLDGRKGSFYTIYDVDIKNKNDKNTTKIPALALQKPESMLKDVSTKKRVWQSILTFCQTHTVS